MNLQRRINSVFRKTATFFEKAQVVGEGGRDGMGEVGLKTKLLQRFQWSKSESFLIAITEVGLGSESAGQGDG